MTIQIKQNKLTEEIKRKVYQGFNKHAIDATGMDGLAEFEKGFVECIFHLNH